MNQDERKIHRSSNLWRIAGGVIIVVATVLYLYSPLIEHFVIYQGPPCHAGHGCSEQCLTLTYAAVLFAIGALMLVFPLLRELLRVWRSRGGK